MRYRHALLATAAALAVLLTGCAAESPTPSPEPTASASTATPTTGPTIPSVTPSADPTDDAAGIPTGEALVEWGEAALPVDSLGGSAPLLRETAVLGPRTDELQVELDLPAGSWTLGVACIGEGAITSDLDRGGVDYHESDGIDCASAPDYAPLPLRIDIDGPTSIRWELESDQPAGVVYQIVESSADR